MSSILDDVKKVLGLPVDDTSFDLDVLMHTNSVFAVLSQLGVGPAEGFMIEDATAQWVDFLGPDLNLNAVKTYIYLRVRMVFDPPATSFALDAMKELIKEAEWRLNVHREATAWVDPTPIDIDADSGLVLDAGTP